MTEIKPTLKIAQAISRRHTLISLKITLPLYLSTVLISIIALKLLGYEHSGILLKQFYNQHQPIILWVAAFIHFVPVNFYAIKKYSKSIIGIFN
jgi:hypothetical protein